MRVWIILLIIAAVLAIALLIFYLLGKRAEKKKAKQDEEMAQTAQTTPMLIIDKKRMRLRDAGLPQQVVEQTPKLLRRSKVPIVKAKVGPRIMSFIADEKIYDEIPIKKEVRATISGLYITGVRGMRAPLPKPPKKKKGFRARLMSSYDKASGEVNRNREEKAAYKQAKANEKAKEKADKERAREKAQAAQAKARGSKETSKNR